MKSLKRIHFAGNHEGEQTNVYHRPQPDTSATRNGGQVFGFSKLPESHSDKQGDFEPANSEKPNT